MQFTLTKYIIMRITLIDKDLTFDKEEGNYLDKDNFHTHENNLDKVFDIMTNYSMTKS